MKQTFISLLFFVLTNSALATEVSENTEDAVKQTQALLTNREAREKTVLSKSPNAMQADRQADVITGGNAAYKDEMYDISASLMPYLVQKGNSDPAAMAKILEEAVKDPEKFLNSLPATEQQKIKALAGKIESSKSSNP